MSSNLLNFLVEINEKKKKGNLVGNINILFKLSIICSEAIIIWILFKNL